MTIAAVSAREKACDFVREFADDRYSLRLLRFFGTHPYVRFSRLAILHAESMDGCKSFLEKALRRLVDQGIVKECVEKGFPLYSLTEDETLCSRVMELANLDWSEWRVVANTGSLSGESPHR
jgi:hypothetical protein